MIKVPLDVGLDGGLTFEELMQHGVQRLDLARAGQQELHFLDGEDAVRKSTPVLDDKDLLELHVPIPTLQQLPLFERERKGRGRDYVGTLGRQDELEQGVIDETVARLRYSADLNDRVGRAMATEPRLAEFLRTIEEREKVDTKPSRLFHYLRQAEFSIWVDGEAIDFKPHIVRTSVSVSEPLDVRATALRPRSDSDIVRLRVESCMGTGREGGVSSGGVHEGRFTGLEWWQGVVLEFAKRQNLVLDLKLVETMSTCTLRAMPADARQVTNWYELLEVLCAELGAVLEAITPPHGARQARSE